MRNGKRPTRAQKIAIQNARLNPDNWLVVRQKTDGELTLLHRDTGRVRIVPNSKEVR